MTKTKRLVRIFASLLAALIMVAAMLCVAPLEINAAEESAAVEYIYFDLAAGDVQITKTTYSGYVFEYGTGIKKAVTGARDGQNDFYVYQTTTANRSTTGWKEDGTIVLPEYTPVTYNGKAWGEYITNHPQHWGAVTDDSNPKSGSNSVKAVIQAWEAAVAGIRESTPYRIIIGDKLADGRKEYTYNGVVYSNVEEGDIYQTTTDNVVGQVNIVIDNIWSSYQVNTAWTKGDEKPANADHKEQNSNALKQYRRSGAITYYATGNNNEVNVTLVGDNRLPNVFYTSSKDNKNKIVFNTRNGDAGSTLTVANNSDDYSGNYWGSAIGGSDNGGDSSNGIIIKGGIIYAGTTKSDDCTAIGGGGNGYGGVTIEGGTVTAVATSSGAAIGGGIGKSSEGGQAFVSITGGNVYAYNYSCVCSKSYTFTGKQTYIPSAAIGGGSSGKSVCKPCTVNISGEAFVYAQSVGGTAIGGGSSADTTGGEAEIIISENATVYANSVGGTIGGTVVEAGVGIGGGTGGTGPINPKDSKKMDASGGDVSLTVSGNAKIYTGSIGGGSTNDPAESKIGAATVIVSGGLIQGQIVMAAGAAQGCSFTMSDGMINNLEHDNDVFKFVQPDGGAVYMDDSKGIVNISGGTIESCTANRGGAIYMTAGTTTISGTATIQNCSATTDGGAIYMGGGTLTMTGGTITDNSAQNGGAAYLAGTGEMTVTGGTLRNNTATSNGGAAYLAGGTLRISGTANIDTNSAQNGGAAYITNGAVVMNGGTVSACTATNNGGAIWVANGSFTMKSGALTDCSATEKGGAVYVANGQATMEGGTITQSEQSGQTNLPLAAKYGGAVCVESGSFEISGGSIEKVAAKLGGAVYVSGGGVRVHGGTLTGCSANEGGAIYVEGGKVTMLGGQITDNHALAGNGGAIYVTGNTELSVKVQSGEISGNSAAVNGGAICVTVPTGVSAEVLVQLGVNALHFNADGTNAQPPCDHNENLDGNGNCPIVKNNVCAKEGGAVYISGSKSARLNIYCLKEGGNRGDGNVAGSPETGLSDFLKVDGGTVLITSEQNGGIYYGDSVINSSIHVTGGDLILDGTLANPAVFAPITVDVKAAGGSFTDGRENDNNATQYYVIRYFENFSGGTGSDPIGQYKVHQTPQDKPHTVWGVVYEHPGFTIVGWNTKGDGSGSEVGVSTELYYKDIDPSQFADAKKTTLALYAIWERDFYWIIFEPNVNSYTGTMGDNEHKIAFSCADETSELPENEYVNLGSKFLGWAYESNAVVPEFEDGDIIPKLSEKFGDKITFYAVWAECYHDAPEKFEFSSSGAHAVTCTCQCSYFVTATITSPDGVRYTGGEHPAFLTYTDNSNGEFNADEHIEAFRNATFIYNEEAAVRPVNAGNYRATATIKSFEIYVDYEIAKAYQTAPEKPKFEVNGNTLTIEEPQKPTGDAKTQVQYKLLHNDEKGDVVPSDPQEGRVFSEFQSSWTLYYVVAFYPGNDNYLPSAETLSDQRYIYQGGISINFINGTGIKETTVHETKNGDQVTVALISTSAKGYYLSSEYGVIEVTGTVSKENGAGLLDMTDPAVFNLYFEKSINEETKQFSYLVKPFADGYTGDITITFSGAKPNPVVNQSVAPDEHFEEIADIATEIASDSAFTTYFHVEHYDSAVYRDLLLSFGASLPKGTTVIMVDQASTSYWYAILGSDAESIAISDLNPMGGGEGDPALAEELKYQFIIDFSDVGMHGVRTLTPQLTATVRPEDENFAPVLQTEGKTVTLKSVSHSVSAPAVSGTDASISSVQYVQGVEHASKWTDREFALVLTPNAAARDKLPIDVSIKVVETMDSGLKTTIYRPDGNGNFVMTIDPNTNSLIISLESQMFNTEEYLFDLQAYAAYEGDAPMNGIPIATYTNLKFASVAKSQNSVKITVTDADPYLYDLDTGEIHATIDCVVSPGYTATVTLMRKHANGNYVSTGWSEELQTPSTQIEITGLRDTFKEEGVFCLVAVIREETSNTEILTDSHYLIIQESHSQ